jgi:integrase
MSDPKFLAPFKLDDKFLEGLQPPASGQFFANDTVCRGFAVLVLPSGTKTFVLRWKCKGVGKGRGVERIGEFPALNVVAARKQAQAMRGEIYGGKKDPAEPRREAREAPTMLDLIKYHAQHKMSTLSPSTQNLHSAHLRKYIIPALGHKLVKEITRTDLIKLYREISGVSEKAATANRVNAFLSVLFGMAIDMDWIVKNPASKIADIPDVRRDRFLDTEEVRRLLEVIEAWPHRTVADAIWMLLHTGARKMEVVAARWEEFDLEERMWVKPAEKIKQRQEHRVALTPEVVDRLRKIRARQSAWRNDECEFVFASNRSSDSGYLAGATLNHAFEGMCQKAGIEKACTVHDLRHTFASHLVINNEPILNVADALGHSTVRTTQRYARRNDTARRATSTRAGEIFAAMAKPKPGAEVVQMTFPLPVKKVANE